MYSGRQREAAQERVRCDWWVKMPAGRERPKASTNQINAKCEMRYRPGRQNGRHKVLHAPPIAFQTDWTVLLNLTFSVVAILPCLLRNVTFIMESSWTVFRLYLCFWTRSTTLLFRIIIEVTFLGRRKLALGESSRRDPKLNPDTRPQSTHSYVHSTHRKPTLHL